MAYIETALRSIALAHAGTAALIGTRYYAAGEAPQAAALPFMTAQRISTGRDHAMGADTGLVEGLVQISIVAVSYTACLALAAQLRAALQDYAGTSETVVIQRVFLENETDLGYDYEPARHSRVMEFRVWHRE